MTQCKRPSKDAPKGVLKAIHKSKMMGKFFRRLDPSYQKPTFLPGGQGHKGVL